MAGWSKKDARRIIDAAVAQGCRTEKRKDGVKILHPNGITTFIIHWSCSDHRAMANTRASFRRAKLSWPFD